MPVFLHEFMQKWFFLTLADFQNFRTPFGLRQTHRNKVAFLFRLSVCKYLLWTNSICLWKFDVCNLKSTNVGSPTVRVIISIFFFDHRSLSGRPSRYHLIWSWVVDANLTVLSCWRYCTYVCSTSTSVILHQLWVSFVQGKYMYIVSHWPFNLNALWKIN